MRKYTECGKMIKLSGIFGLLLLSGCSILRVGSGRGDVELNGPVVDASSANSQGVVQMVWEEPMVDVIDQPPGLDPEGRYYRPAHQAVVEIRQGRWKQAEK